MRTSELLSLEIIGLVGTSSANLEDLVNQVEALIIARDTLKSMYADQDAPLKRSTSHDIDGTVTQL